MNAQNTVSSAGNRTVTRLQNIIYVIFLSWELMREKQTHFKQTRGNGQQTATCPKIYEGWSNQHFEAKDSAITSVTSTVYMRMIIQDVALKSVLHTRCIGQTTWTHRLVWDCWSVNEIFEKMSQVESTWGYDKYHITFSESSLTEIFWLYLSRAIFLRKYNSGLATVHLDHVG